MIEKFTGLYDIRDVKPTDKSFILATFLRGLYHGDSWFSLIPRRIFMDNYKTVCQSLVSEGNSIIKIACLKDEPDVIIGYSILSNDYQTIHWVFVKKSWREKGVGRSLLPQYPVAISHLTKLGKQLMTKFENVIFNPFI